MKVSSYRVLPLLVFLLISHISFSQSEIVGNKKKTSNQTSVEKSEFIPITTDKYTDPNYSKNLKKSNSEIERLIHPPIIIEPEALSYKQQLKVYKTARDKYTEGSVEYNQIQSKINNLIFNHDNQ